MEVSSIIRADITILKISCVKYKLLTQCNYDSLSSCNAFLFHLKLLVLKVWLILVQPQDSDYLHYSHHQLATTLLICGRTLTTVGSNHAISSPITGPLYLETTKEADSIKALEFDEEGYPCLPENVMELQFHHRKAILRQYMAAVKHKYHFIPILYCDYWT